MRDFNHTVGVLVKAYLNNTLQHTNCHACAVGNMVAHAKGIGFFTTSTGAVYWKQDRPKWFDSLFDGQVLYDCEYLADSVEQAEATGYTYKEIARIEQAFESVVKSDIGEYDDDGYKGLMAVVDVLADIHGIDLTQREQAKLLFVKA